MQIHVRSVQLPRWVTPLLIVVALALIPFALMLGLALGVVLIGASVARLLFSSSVKSPSNPFEFPFLGSGKKFQDHSAIDAEYAIKDTDEKK